MKASGIASTLQAALDDWRSLAPRLNALSEALNAVEHVYSRRSLGKVVVIGGQIVTTVVTLCRAEMSRIGSPCTAMTSASQPGLSIPLVTPHTFAA